MNLKLLTGEMPYDSDVHLIHRAIINLRKENLPKKVYRLLNMSVKEFDWYEVGSTIYTYSFTSTSTTELQNWQGNTLMVIELKDKSQAADISKWSKYPHENEVLLALNSPLKVLKKCKFHQEKNTE
eukprot:TRINITY_DN7124_c0_g1_i3.p1 TRINITY_DN7124_c0_g1~~TRINITY_DN7124_c0_g1_i3.p1  ORF type:complete len:126 (-),score=5.12 TRINITY_DN7124_c0_g1_i3:99-476(-)